MRERSKYAYVLYLFSCQIKKQTKNRQHLATMMTHIQVYVPTQHDGTTYKCFWFQVFYTKPAYTKLHIPNYWNWCLKAQRTHKAKAALLFLINNLQKQTNSIGWQ
jgi:hypothetical protein